MVDEPLRTTTFRLTRSDAFAYEQAIARWSLPGMIALGVWLLIWALAAYLLPRNWSGSPLGWTFPILLSVSVAIGYVLVLVGLSLRQWIAAGRRLKAPLEVTVTEYPDRLRTTGAPLPAEFGLREIRESILTPTHLFLVTDAGVLMLPKSAFEEQGVLEDLAARIAGRPVASSRATPVDPRPDSA